MSRLPNYLVYTLLDEAERAIAAADGTTPTGQSALRRAVSSGYYGVFHAVCTVCAASLVGWARSDLIEPIYRTVDHGQALRKLRGADAKEIGRPVERLAVIFGTLMEQHHRADYSPPALLFTSGDVRALLAQAREAVALLETLDELSRKRLAILLIAKPR